MLDPRVGGVPNAEDDAERPVGPLPEPGRKRRVGARGIRPGNLIRARQAPGKGERGGDSDCEGGDPNREDLPTVAQDDCCDDPCGADRTRRRVA